MSERPDLRYELKMVCQASARERLLARMRIDPAGLSTLFPPRRVQSIYFDTIFQRALEENLAGISHREKLRFRWYGEAQDTVRGTLECKVRENMLGWKYTLPIERDVRVAGVDRTRFARELLAGLPDLWARMATEAPAPVQWISYRREYFSTADSSVRVTVDSNLVVCDLRNRFILRADYPTPIPKLVIVEAKCGEADYDSARALLGRLPLQVDKCSKFVLASSPGEGPMASILPE